MDRVRLSATHPLQLQEVPLSTAIAPHDHKFYELCFVLSGTVQHLTNAGSERICAGTLLVLPLGAVHAFRQPQSCRVLDCYYLAEWLLNDLRSFWNNERIIDLFFAAHLFRAASFRLPWRVRLDPAARGRVFRGLKELASELAEPIP